MCLIHFLSFSLFYSSKKVSWYQSVDLRVVSIKGVVKSFSKINNKKYFRFCELSHLKKTLKDIPIDRVLDLDNVA